MAWLAVVEFIRLGGFWPLARLMRPLSYFTILSNLLVAVVATASLWRAGGNSFLTRPSTASAAAVYITAVWIYSHSLREPWNTAGPWLVTTIALHDVVPILYLLYWLVFVTQGTLKWVEPINWLVYPLAYVAWVLLCGWLSGEYPFYFPHLGQRGYAEVVATMVVLLSAFLVLGLIAVAIDHGIGRVRARWEERY